jgi:hypothetical protein
MKGLKDPKRSRRRYNRRKRFISLLEIPLIIHIIVTSRRGAKRQDGPGTPAVQSSLAQRMFKDWIKALAFEVP